MLAGRETMTTLPTLDLSRLGRGFTRLLLLAFAASIVALLSSIPQASADTTTGLPGAAGSKPHVVAGPDDTSVIVDVNFRLERIAVHRCPDRECSSWDSVTLDVDLSPYGASDWHVRSDGDGRIFVVIPGYTALSQQQVLIACAQPLCDGGDANIVPLPGQAVSRVRVDADGFVAARVSVDNEPYAFHCNDATCTSSTLHPLPNDLPRYASDIELVGLEFVTTVLHGSTQTLETTRCIDACAATTTTSAPMPTSVFGGSGQRIVTFVPPTLPQRQVHVVLRRGPDGPNNTLIDCVIPECTTPIVTPLVAAIPLTSAIAINDLGHAVYIAEGRVITCDDPSCATRTTSPIFEQPRHLRIDELGRPSLLSRGWSVTCDSRSCGATEFPPIVRGACNGVAYVATSGPGEWSMRSGQSESSRRVSVGQEYMLRLTGRDLNAPSAVIVMRDGVEVASSVLNFDCVGPMDHDAAWVCQADQGRIDVRVASPDSSGTFDVHVGDRAPQRVTIDSTTFHDEIRSSAPPGNAGVIATATALLDGPTRVRTVDVATGIEVFGRTFAINCGFQAVAGAEVTIVSSCLGAGGRIDTNIVATKSGAMEYTVLLYTGNDPRIGSSPQLPQLARKRTVVEGDWWRSPLTGRPSGIYTMLVKRGNVEIVREQIEVACEPGAESIDEPEVQVVNACRDGLGYILFLFANATTDTKSWVIEFTGVQNRSTSAAAWAQSIKAVTGRPSGVYTATINGSMTFTVDVQCGSVT